MKKRGSPKVPALLYENSAKKNGLTILFNNSIVNPKLFDKSK